VRAAAREGRRPVPMHRARLTPLHHPVPRRPLTRPRPRDSHSRHLPTHFTPRLQALTTSLRSLAALASSQKQGSSHDRGESGRAAGGGSAAPDGTAAAVAAALASLSDTALSVLRADTGLTPDQICGLAQG